MSPTKNLFCNLEDLSNEATVEQFFVNRLLSELHYKDSQIRPKKTLDDLTVRSGRKKQLFRPDYAIAHNRRTRWVIEAKGVTEGLDDATGQCAGYSLLLNQAVSGANPTTHFVVTNGVTTKVFEWDSAEPILELNFLDFYSSSAKWKKFQALLSPTAVATRAKAGSTTVTKESELTIGPASISEINAAFAWCHRHIYRREHLSYSAAFMEFVKIIFLKLLSDRDVHKKYPALASGSVQVPSTDVEFSKAWIQRMESSSENPVDQVLFSRLIKSLEEQILEGTRKRIFNSDEHIGLSPDTIKGVVEKLEGMDLYSIDSDLNGRLFETFLNATLRGKDLGQFFTPRSVVRLATRLADIKVSPQGSETVVDACCGTGGFLIESLADMWAKVDGIKALSNEQRQILRHEIATQRVYGVDVAKDPALARIARINMYLHGDGGSSIFQFDALDKQLASIASDPAPLKAERREFQKRLASELFDVVLTNPPFAKDYSRKTDPEARVLDEYALAFDTAKGKRRPLASLRSSILFLERYHDLLKPGGRLVTVIDDSIVGGDREIRVRDWLRQKFIIKAVISLPGDAFQRSQARVKTSILILEKRTSKDQEQPPIFMYYCTSVGVDDVARQRVLPIDEVHRRQATQEIDRVTALYKAYQRGETEADPWVVDPDVCTERWDVKACLPEKNRSVEAWKEHGATVGHVRDLLVPVFLADGEEDEAGDFGAADEPDGTPVTDTAVALEETRADDLIATASSEEEVTHLRVRYDGFAEAAETIVASDSGYRNLYRVRTGDIVISHINAVHGAIAIVPPHLKRLVVTTEYTVCRAREGYDPRLVWELLRSPEVRSEFLLASTGIGRSRVRWSEIADVAVPIPATEIAEAVVNQVRDAENRLREAQDLYEKARMDLNDAYGLDNETARALLAAFKPPR